MVLIAEGEENLELFSVLDGILKPYTFNELKSRKIDFSSKILNIEELKAAMLKNLFFSVKKDCGEMIDEKI
ncbi:MAG: hypothetical protein K2P17_05760 [Helicobacteraceae bacterium]|nr:hypothetical protein [Helicobacteraceae bacterium]